MAAHAVLATTELLEGILEHVEIKTLLTSCQLVCRSWTILIESSPRLQRALFLLAETAPGSPAAAAAPRRMNPLLEQHFHFWFNRPGRSWIYLVQREINGYHIFAASELYRAGFRCAGDNPYLRRDASWRRMLFAQPPVTAVGIVESNVSGPQRIDDVSIHRWSWRGGGQPAQVGCFGMGLRMGDLYDFVHRHCATWESSGFALTLRVDEMSEERFFHESNCPLRLRGQLSMLRDGGIQILLRLFTVTGPGSVTPARVPVERRAFWRGLGTMRDEI